MIDFALNEVGDISLEEPKTIPPFKLDFTTGNLPKLRIKFHANTRRRPRPKNALKIDFMYEKPTKGEQKKIGVVSGDSEKAQSIAIRLKTELGELENFFYEFGSELEKIRHQDLLNKNNWAMVERYVTSSVSDIISADNILVNVSRSKSNGSFTYEKLDITIIDKNTSEAITYSL